MGYASKYYSRSCDIDPDRKGDELGIVFPKTCILTCYSYMRSHFCNGAQYLPSDEEITQHYQWINETLAMMSNVTLKIIGYNIPTEAATDTD